MKNLIVMMGLPRSGKTTWVKENMIPRGIPVVGLDEIRLSLHGQRFASVAEPYVWAVAHTMVEALFRAGHQWVCVDETSMTTAHRDQWNKSMVCDNCYFKHIETPFTECIDRAQRLNDPYIIPVIERMASQYQPLEAGEMTLREADLPPKLPAPDEWVGGVSASRRTV